MFSVVISKKFDLTIWWTIEESRFSPTLIIQTGNEIRLSYSSDNSEMALNKKTQDFSLMRLTKTGTEKTLGNTNARSNIQSAPDLVTIHRINNRQLLHICNMELITKS